MSSESSQPSPLASRLLRCLGPRKNQEALTGDLLETFSEGRSNGWFWRQVLIAILVGVATELRIRWPQISFAIAGTALLWSSGRIIRIPAIERLGALGWGLEWPMSTVYAIAFHSAFFAVLLLPILAVCLLLGRTFKWSSMLRTFLISFSLLVVGALLGLLPQSTIASASSRFLFPLLIAAWVGCQSPNASRTLSEPRP